MQKKGDSVPRVAKYINYQYYFSCVLPFFLREKATKAEAISNTIATIVITELLSPVAVIALVVFVLVVLIEVSTVGFGLNMFVPSAIPVIDGEGVFVGPPSMTMIVGVTITSGSFVTVGATDTVGITDTVGATETVIDGVTGTVIVGLTVGAVVGSTVGAIETVTVGSTVISAVGDATTTVGVA